MPGLSPHPSAPRRAALSASSTASSKSLLGAYEALLEAKAMLHGEEAPLEACFPTEVSGASSRLCPTPSPDHTGGDVWQGHQQSVLRPPPTKSLCGGANTTTTATATHSCCGFSCYEDAGGGSSQPSDCSNGATLSRHRSFPDAFASSTTTITTTRNTVAHSDTQPIRTLYKSSVLPSVSNSASPDAQRPSYPTTQRAADAVGTQHSAPRVQFSHSPDASHRDAAATVAARRASLSPLPVPPPLPPQQASLSAAAAAAAAAASSAVNAHGVSAVDAQTLALLQCLTYDEVEQVRESLSQLNSSMLHGSGWGLTPTPVRDDLEESVARLGVPGVTPPLASPLLWDEEPPVQLDVDAQLRYSKRFYALLTMDGEEEEEDQLTSEASQRRRGAAEDGSAAEHTPAANARPLAASHNASDAASETPLSSYTLDSTDGDDELSLSPIARSSRSGSPAAQLSGRGQQRYVADEAVSSLPLQRTHFHHAPPLPPPTAGPSILLSPQRERHRSASLSPRLCLSPSAAEWLRSPSSPSPPLPSRAGVDISRSSSSASPSLWSLADFDLCRRIGTGASGRAYLAREKQSKAVVALKCVDRRAMAERYGVEDAVELVARSARLQRMCSRKCAHVAKLYTFFTDAHHIYLTLEYADEGDLASYAARQPQGKVPESQVRAWMRQLAEALQCLHAHSIVHGSVAPRHVLLGSEEETRSVKLSGFLHAVKLRNGHDSAALHHCAALDYAAPEVILYDAHSCKSDLWALGVMTYELLCGFLPFEHVSAAQAKRLICTGAVFYPQTLSATAKSFIGGLLCVDEAGRSSAADALRHPFLASTPPSATPVRRSEGPQRAGGAAPPSTPAGAAQSGIRVLRRTETLRERPPVSRDLSLTFSEVDDAVGDTSVAADTPAATATASSPWGGLSTTSFIPLGQCTTLTDGTSQSSSTSSPLSGVGQSGRGGSHSSPSADRDGEDSAGTSVMTAAPPFSFLSFALPTHSWQSSTQPYGTGAFFSVLPTSPHLPPSSAVLSSGPGAGQCEEAATGGQLQRRSSGASVKSAAVSSRPSLTATLSDVSASFLSTTCAPPGEAALAQLMGVEGPHFSGSNSSSSTNRQHSHHPHSNNRGGRTSSGKNQAGVQRCHYLVEGEQGESCVQASVTLSSLTAASPLNGQEWPSVLEVSASSGTAESTPHVTLRRDREARGGPPTAYANAVKEDNFQSAGQHSTGAQQATATVKASAGAAIKKGRDCAMRLNFDSASDDEW